MRSDFLYEVQGGPRPPGLAAVADRPGVHSRDQALLEAESTGGRAAGAATGQLAGLTGIGLLAEQVVAYDRPTAESYAQGLAKGPSLMFVTGLTEGGGRRCLRRGAKLPATRRGPPPPVPAPRRQTGRRTSLAVRCLSRSGPILPKEADPAPSQQVSCPEFRGVRDRVIKRPAGLAPVAPNRPVRTRRAGGSRGRSGAVHRVYHATHRKTARSTSSKSCHGPRCSINSALNVPFRASAIALS